MVRIGLFQIKRDLETVGHKLLRPQDGHSLRETVFCLGNLREGQRPLFEDEPLVMQGHDDLPAMGRKWAVSYPYRRASKASETWGSSFHLRQTKPFGTAKQIRNFHRIHHPYLQMYPLRCARSGEEQAMENLKMMAAYNRWANGLVYDAAATLSEDELHRDTGAFFGSIFGTLSHLVTADRVWLHRFTGEGRVRQRSTNALARPLPSCRRCGRQKTRGLSLMSRA